MVLHKLSCRKDASLDQYAANMKECFNNLHKKYNGDNNESKNDDNSFDIDTKKGRSNIQNIIGYTIQQAKCTPGERSFTHIKTLGFEIIKILTIILILTKLIFYIMRDVHGPDYTSKISNVADILEICLTFLVAISLWLKFDTSAFYMNIITLKKTLLLFMAAILFVTTFSIFQSDFAHSKIKVGIAGSLILLLTLLMIKFRNKDIKLSDQVNAIIKGWNNHVNPFFQKSEIKWRHRFPNFTDITFISIASYLLFGSAVSKLSKIK